MLTLCTTETQKADLKWLMGHMSQTPQRLDGTHAWTVFSSGGQTVKLTRGVPDFQVSKQQRESFTAIKEAAVKVLMERCGRACAYCRRPVGNYGYGWHIEHFKAKGADWRYTFDLANLLVACVDCNSWKRSQVECKPAARAPVIINPTEKGFDYSKHLRFVQFSTESVTFAKYLAKEDPGKATYGALRFDLIERCLAINRIDNKAADLHERLTRAMTNAADDPGMEDFAALLSKLREHIYKAPQTRKP